MNTQHSETETTKPSIEQLRAHIAALTSAITTIDLQIRAFPEGFSGSPFENIREQYEYHRAASLSIPNQFLELVNSLDGVDNLKNEEFS